MNAFKIIEMAEGKEASDAFRTYFDALNISEEKKDEISKWKPSNPLYIKGFHPAFALHMIEYNKTLTQPK